MWGRCGQSCCRGIGAAVLCFVAAGGATAEPTWTRPTLNLYGVPGIWDMPTAHPMLDADASFTIGGLDQTQRNTFHFQITPRLSGTFRYAFIDNFIGSGNFYDRSFDLRYTLQEETARGPAITLGLQDFGGTGVYAGEYIVATKTFGRLRATGGIGWGRFGSAGGFDNPLGVLSDRLRTRPAQPVGGQTGRLDADHWFRGDAAFFGGVQYLASDHLILSAEMSSDAYDLETARIGFDRRSALNFGATYRFDNGATIGAGYLYGDTLALNLSYTVNPKARIGLTGGTDTAPPLVQPRAPGAVRDLGWTEQPDGRDILTLNVRDGFADQGLRLGALRVDATRAIIHLRNPTYQSPAQAIGRAARVLTARLPASVETIEIIPFTTSGLATAKITLYRQDMEALEFSYDNAWLSYARAQISEVDLKDTAIDSHRALQRPFSWGLGPFVDFSFFDPDNPVRADIGIEAHARYEPMPGFVLSGQIKQRLGGNRDGTRLSDSVLPHVRSDVALYAAEADLTLPILTGAYFFRPGDNLYGRVTLGYLEEMFGGLSGEVLWKPVTSDFAIGAELNFVQQRDFDQQFGFRDYDVTTGHVSAYYDLGNGFQTQVDVGRYLAGDWGATVSLDRAFKNGVRIGAFATLTDVSFEDFGEGAFDKGIRFSVPLASLIGNSDKRSVVRTIRPTTRDGGARLIVQDRLYEQVRETHKTALNNSWARFWR